MEVSEVMDVLTALVAIAGLALSIYNLYERKAEKRTKLRVKIFIGKIADRKGSEEYYMMEVFNVGIRRVSIISVVLDVQTTRYILVTETLEGTTKLPFNLSPGDKETFWTPAKDYDDRLPGNFTAVFIDSNGNEYRSKKTRFVKN